MSYKVLITEPVNTAGITLLKDHGFQVVMGTGYDEATLIREACDADAVLTRNGRFTERVLCSCPRLKVISMHGVGVDCIDVKAAQELGIQVTNAADSNSVSVAEFTIGLLLSLAKNIPQANSSLKENGWASRSAYTGFDLQGKTLGILGMGKIGTAVARRAGYGLGMKVLGYKRGFTADVDADYAVLTSDMDYVISRADFLSIHLPLNDGTLGLVSREKLALMKQNSYILNLGRGGIIDEATLAAMLQSGKLAGAALDVFAGEIPDSENPLLHMDNVIVTPHVAGLSIQAMERMSYQAAQGIVETLEGREITYAVNHPERGTDVLVA